MHAAFREALGDADIAILNGGGPKPARFTELALPDWDDAYRLLLRGMLELLGQSFRRCVPRAGAASSR